MSIDSLLLVAALISGAVLLYKVLNVGRRVKDYPPGPSTLPVVGNALDFPNKRAHFRYEACAIVTVVARDNNRH
jgi:hypothetical protein